MFNINLDVLGISFGIYVGPDEWLKFRDYVRSKGGEIEDEPGDMQHNGRCHGSLIWVQSATDVKAWVHETHHAAKEALLYHGIENEEMRAHTQGWLLDRIHRRLSSKKIRWKWGP